MLQDVRWALRTIARNPAFSTAVIVSLALGIGANTAVFSVWNAVVRAPLPGVRDADGLVMLSNPDHARMIRGRWLGRRHGPRPLFTYAEFEQFRDQAGTFSGVMASQCALLPWRVRFEGAAWENVHGRLVSAGYFLVLGVDAAVGRLFTAGGAEETNRSAVISHQYWRRRFGGDPNVIGRSFAIGKTVLTIVGVAAPGFVGETSGQRADLWMPIEVQPLIDGPRDLLREAPPTKFMWLHVFARLKPGVTPARAEDEATGVFRASLAAFYGSSGSEVDQAELREERLLVRPGARGASTARAEFSTSLTALLIAVGVLLLITCVNLANMQLARAVSQQSEVAIRAAIGAARGAILRQVVTESLTLGIIGGALGIGLASVLHSALVQLMTRTDTRLDLAFALEPIVQVFVLGAAAIAGVVMGVPPAWYAARLDAAAALQGRGTGRAGHMVSRRVLASAQLALSFPLLVAAGLLVRTFDNLQRADLGFDQDGLLVVRVNTAEAAPDLERRAQLVRDLRSRLQEIPGVRAVTTSRHGLFTGTFATTTVEVEGFTPADEGDKESAVEPVGPEYFSTLAVPLVQGREIVETDGGDAPKVCVLNQAFVDRYFEKRNPLGLHVTTVADNGPRTTYRVVGVVGNMRLQNVREPVQARLFVPSDQRPAGRDTPIFLVQDFPVFIVRTSTAPAALIQTVRATIERVDVALPILSARTFEEQMSPTVAQDRTNAELALVFGVLALAVAVVGLYAVVSYGTARRSAEIAVRIAVGAPPARIIGMVLGEIAAVVAAGLVLGGWFAFAAARLIESRLFGVAARDALTLALAAIVLVGVALIAAFIPARRAARVDPMIALHRA